MGFKMFSESV